MGNIHLNGFKNNVWEDKDMIRKFSYGNPIETEAVVKSIEKANGDVPYFTMLQTDGVEGTISFSLNMEDDDIVYQFYCAVNDKNERFIALAASKQL